MVKQNSNLIVAAFFDRLLDQQASQASVDDAHLQHRQILCGRWLALRRLNLGLSLEQLAEATQISPQSILFVETGLANQDVEPDADWKRYSDLLSTLRERIWARQVLAIALGQVSAPSERVINRVKAELDAVYTAHPPKPAPSKSKTESTASRPWTQVLRWIGERLRPSGKQAEQPIALSVADLEAATLLKLPQIDPGMVANIELSEQIPAPPDIPNSLLSSIRSYLTTDSSPRDMGVSEPTVMLITPTHQDLGAEIRGFIESLLDSLDRLVQPIGGGSTHRAERPVSLTTDGPPQILGRFESSSLASEEDAYATLELSRPETAEEAVAHVPRLLLLGEPGSGKSTIVRYLARRLAHAMLDRSIPLPKGWNTPKIPLLCSLETLSHAIDGRAPRDDDELLQCLVAPHTPANLPIYSGQQQLREALLRGEGLLLLDGLDNVSAAPGPDGRSPRAQLAAAIRMLGGALPQMTQIVVTCRTRIYKQSSRGRGNDWHLTSSDGWQQRTLQPYTIEQMRLILQRGLNWPASLTNLAWSKSNAAAALPDRVLGDRQLTRLYSSPLALSLLLMMLSNEQLIELPITRVSLYDRFVTTILHKTHDNGASIPPLSMTALPSDERSAIAICRVALQTSAFEALRLGSSAVALRQYFTQTSLQSFLAACHLAITANLEQRAYMLWQGADGERWRETLLLAVEQLQQLGLIAERLVPWLTRLVAPIAPDGSRKSSRQRQHDALLAADSYAAVGGRTGMAVIADEELVQFEHTLTDALADVLVPLPLADELDRFSAGLHLAALGDRRPGVTDAEPAWCRVQADQPSMLWIGRYLVTNSQWRRFIEDGGYSTPRWWDEGWEYRTAAGWTQPRFWDVPEYNQPNQPVVGISWYEASAFCRWLTEYGRAAGWLNDAAYVRLPTVAEWQQAAYGIDDRPYPWGDSWDTGSANTIEAGLGGPLAVGCYPHSASPCGALDMAGNVAEWCDPDPTASDQRPVRCGGSWAEDQQVVQRGAMPTCTPDTRGNLLGLRLIAVRLSQ